MSGRAARPGTPALPRRRVLAGAAAALAASTLLAACQSSPPVRWYALPVDAPEGPPPRPADSASGTGPSAPPDAAAAVWALSMDVALPGALDRDTLWVARGTAGLQPLVGHRWAEPLRHGVPRVLLADLQRLRGPARVWPAPAPAGVAVARRLRVALTVLQPAEDRRTLRLAAQWWWQDTAAPASAPERGEADFTVPVADATVDALAGAHRLALWRLAGRITDDAQ